MFSRLLLIAAIAVAAPALPAAASSEAAEEADAVRHRVLVIGLDLSRSNPLVDSDAYARKVADRVQPMVAALPLRSQIMVRSFGSFDATSNTLRIDETVSARARPEDLARGIATLVAGVPKLVRDGRLVAQNHTNILPFLSTMEQVVDCASQDVSFVLLTDGVEDSEFVRLAGTNATLPLPEEPRFAGCRELQILGLGQGQTSPRTIERLRATWADWAGAAGFEAFTGLYDW